MKSLTSYIVTESDSDALIKKYLSKYEVIEGEKHSLNDGKSKTYTDYVVICRSKEDIKPICTSIVDMSIEYNGGDDKIESSLLDRMIEMCNKQWNDSPLEEESRYIQIPFFI